MIATIFFDVYGTLISTGTGSVDAARKILETAGSDLDPAAFYKRWKQLHKAHMAEPFCREADIFRKDLAALYAEHGILRDAQEDAAPMLASLYGRKAYEDTVSALANLRKTYRLIIASNTDTEPLMENLSKMDIEFDGIYTSEMLMVYKPRAEFYEKLLEKTGVKSTEAVFVGDSLEEDVLAPKRMGMMGVLLDRKESYCPEGRIFQPDVVIRTLEELETVLAERKA